MILFIFVIKRLNLLPFIQLNQNILGIQMKCMGKLIAVIIQSVISDSLQPHGLQHTRLPCPPPSSGVCLNSYLLSHEQYEKGSSYLILNEDF